MELQPNGKVALVTGASALSRPAIAAELAREDMHLCLLTRDSAKLREGADRLRHITSINIMMFPADLRGPADVGQAIAQTVAHFGRLALPVNNAWATSRPDSFALTEQDCQNGLFEAHGHVRLTRADDRVFVVHAAASSIYLTVEGMPVPPDSPSAGRSTSPC